MKVLYAIQGTGNGHLCRALDIIPALQSKCEVDLLISGTQGDINLPYDIKYRFKGLSFIFGKKGGVDLWQTLKQNNFNRLLSEIRSLPLENYDLVVNDFEPVSAWGAILKNIPCFALSHQAAVLDKLAPLPKKNDRLGRFILKRYAPASRKFGFHFSQIHEHIFTPVIRSQVRKLKISNKGHFTVYLPSYSDKKLVKILNTFPQIKWEVFSKHNREEKTIGNIHIQKVNNEKFLESMASCKGIICGAGFETPAEALYLKKKLLVVPMKNQYEQHCNAAALKQIGVSVLPNLKPKKMFKIEKWLKEDLVPEVNFPDRTTEIVEILMEEFHKSYLPTKDLSITEGLKEI